MTDDDKLKPQFAAAALTLNQYGICKEVHIDGHKLPYVAEARVIVKPGEVTRLVLEIYVSTVATITEPGA
jgi:hypothetical protein